MLEEKTRPDFWYIEDGVLYVQGLPPYPLDPPVWGLPLADADEEC